MNKKFSTLAASLLLASAFSTAAYAAPGVGTNVKEGDYVQLLDGTGKALEIATDNSLQFATAVTNDIAKMHAQLWQVASLKYNVQTGIPVYQFINKATGQYLAIKLKTNNNGKSTETKLDANGNKDWIVNTSTGVLSVFANDSTYTLDGANLKLKAEKGTNVPTGAVTLDIHRDAAGSVTLNAAMLNALMVDGKLYFNDANVSEGNENILTASPWKAYAEGTIASSTNFFLMRADKDSVTSVNKNPNLLMVDTMKYAGGDYHKLVIDTLAITKAQAALLKDQTGASAFAKGSYAPTIATFARQIATAVWSAKYTMYNDSISLTAASVPTKESVVATYYDAARNKTFTKASSGFALADIPGYTAATMSPITAGTSPLTKLGVVSAAIINYLDGASATSSTLAGTMFVAATGVVSGGTATWAELLTAAETWVKTPSNNATDKDKAFLAWAKTLDLAFSAAATNGSVYYLPGYSHVKVASEVTSPVALKQLANAKVLTVANDGTSTAITAPNAAGYIAPLIQPYATTGGNAVINGNGKVYFLQLAAATESVPTLRAGIAADKYLVVNPLTGAAEDVDAVDATNVYAQWAFIQGATGSYQVVNRGTGKILYAGPVSKGEEADTYVIGGDTYKLAGVDLSDAAVYDEKGTKYDYTGAFYAGPADGVSQSFAIAPASQFLTALNVQFNKDSVLVLGDAANAPQWYLKAGTPATYGYSVPGLPDLKKVTYKIYTKDAEGAEYYVYSKTVSGKAVFAITKSDSGNTAADFEFSTVEKDTYLLLVPAATAAASTMATINLNLTEPTIEVSSYTTKRQDYFTILKSEYSDYRTLTAEDGVDGNAKIFMENEPSRFLYENTQNIVANNGNKIAKDSLNFLGIFNADAMIKNAALYIDTAYVDRKDNTKPLYMIALGVEKVAATAGTACTESGKHFDANGKETTADKCVHATPGTEGYKTGRYLVSLKDSVPTGFAKHPAIYDNCVRLAFVDAKHIADTLVISDSKFTGTKNAVNDSIKIGATPNKATFALKIKDQATQSFVMETVGGNTYVRILNGVPVLTGDIKEAAVFNIEATEENATANEAIEAAGVQVIGGKGAVTVQGAAGKVITVANVLGQTIANQVAASDNVTIAVPAGIVVVAVEGEATKVVVK